MTPHRNDEPRARVTDNGGVRVRLLQDHDSLTLDLSPALMSDDEIEAYLDALSATTRAALESFQVRRHSPLVGA